MEDTSLGKVSIAMNIPKSTLGRWKNNPDITLGTGSKCVLDPWEELLIVEALVYLGRLGFPSGRPQLSYMVYSYCLNLGKVTPFPGGCPGPVWILGFERRHVEPLVRRYCEGLA